jgi:hypothetical protein
MDGHEQAFARFQGCIYDSQKPVVLRWEALGGYTANLQSTLSGIRRSL